MLTRSHIYPLPAQPGDWVTVGGDSRNRYTAPGDVPLRIDGPVWRRRTGGVANSDPVIRGGVLFFSGRDRRLEVFDALTGRRLFRDRFDGPVTGVLADDSGFVFGTDQDERRLFFFSYDPVRQRRAVDIPTSAAAPRRLPDGSLLIAGLNGRLLRLDPQGKEIWSVRTPGPISAPPTVADSLILVAGGRSVSARRISDGSQVWSHQSAGAVIAAPAADDRAYFGSTDSIFYALSLDDGTMAWFFAASGQIVTSPAIGPDRVYVAANDRHVYALDKNTGHKVWSYDTGAPAKMPVTLVGDTLLVGTQTARLVLLDAATGDELRTFPLQAATATAPVVADGRVYIADTRRNLYCFGPRPPAETLSATSNRTLVGCSQGPITIPACWSGRIAPAHSVSPGVAGAPKSVPEAWGSPIGRFLEKRYTHVNLFDCPLYSGSQNTVPILRGYR